MANRSLRRAPNGSGKPTVIGERELGGIDDSVQREPGTVTDADRSADIDDSNVDGESNSTKPVRIVEISPERLGDFIRDRAGTDSGTDSGDSTSRVRKPRAAYGSRKGTRKQEKNQNIEPLVTMVHTWGAILLKTPELMLSDVESKKLSESYAQFCEHHEVPVLTAKRMSEINLIVAVLSIYGPRLVAVKNRKKAERGTGNVTQMPNRGVVNH